MSDDNTRIVPSRRRENFGVKERMAAVGGKYKGGMISCDDVAMGSPAARRESCSLSSGCSETGGCGDCLKSTSVYQNSPVPDYYGANCNMTPWFPKRVTRIHQETSCPEYCPSSELSVGPGFACAGKQKSPKYFKLDKNTYAWGQGRCSINNMCGMYSNCGAQSYAHPGSAGYNVAVDKMNTTYDKLYNEAENMATAEVYNCGTSSCYSNEPFNTGKWKMNLD